MPVNDLLARILRQQGGRLLNRAVSRALPPEPPVQGERKNLLSGLAGAVAVRVATRSVPGAIVVGTGLVAKKLYDRRRANKREAAPAPAQKSAKNDTPKA